MALHTKKDFAELCGMTTKLLSVYASKNRCKVVYSGDYVDDKIEPNISFLRKWAGKNKAEKNTPLPPVELPEDFFDELMDDKDEPSTYNTEAEKKAVAIMVEADKEKQPLLLIPVCLTRYAIAQGFFDAYNLFLKREVEVLRKAGIEPTPERIAQLINYYSGNCRKSVENCLKDFEFTVSNIIDDYAEPEEEK